jgi:hypothetical protein
MMVFFLEITNIWQRSGDFWFADFFSFLKLLIILNFKNPVLSNTIFRAFLIFTSIFVPHDGVLIATEIHRLGPVDLKIYSLERQLTRQLTKISRFSAKLST